MRMQLLAFVQLGIGPGGDKQTAIPPSIKAETFHQGLSQESDSWQGGGNIALAYEITVAGKAKKFLRKLYKINKRAVDIIDDHISELEWDPITPRPHADIIKMENTNPPEYRMRIGAKIRVVYSIEGYTVTIKEIIYKRRTSDYRR